MGRVPQTSCDVPQNQGAFPCHDAPSVFFRPFSSPLSSPFPPPSGRKGRAPSISGPSRSTRPTPAPGFLCPEHRPLPAATGWSSDSWAPPSSSWGVIVKSYDAQGRLLHHGLVDQGPIDEVLSRALYHKEERIQILGIFKASASSHAMVLRIRLFSRNRTRHILLPRALSLLLSRIGSQPDLVWAAR